MGERADVRVDGEDVPADGFSLFGLVEIAVELDLGDGFGMPDLEMDLSWCSIRPLFVAVGQS